VYDRFLDNIEPDEHRYHEGDSLASLRHAADLPGRRGTRRRYRNEARLHVRPHAACWAGQSGSGVGTSTLSEADGLGPEFGVKPHESLREVRARRDRPARARALPLGALGWRRFPRR
jgi:hypothetical protein